MTFSSPGVNRDMMTSSLLVIANMQIVLHFGPGVKEHVQEILHMAEVPSRVRMAAIFGTRSLRDDRPNIGVAIIPSGPSHDGGPDA